MTDWHIMDKYNSWFNNFRQSEEYNRLKDHPVAYFCAEYALRPEMSIYAGGLGVLAGDMVKVAFKQHFPMVAVGLYYHCGYQDVPGEKLACDAVAEKLTKLGIEPVLNEKGEKLVLDIPSGDGTIKIQAWKFEQNTIPVYLLDSNIEANSTEDKAVCSQLYAPDRETRIKQELILGVGGFRLLEALNIYPSLYHLNEGHSAFISLEVIRSMILAHGVSFAEAVKLAKDRIVFTNHTLIYEGQDFFDPELIGQELKSYTEDLKTSMKEIVDLGLDGAKLFSMTNLSLKTSCRSNAVSKIHAAKAADLWPGYNMIPITNGVFLEGWDKITNEESIFAEHLGLKKELLEFVNSKYGTDWSENDFIIGWARRFVNYKRPLALFENVKKYLEMIGRAKCKVRVIFSGLPHPADQSGQEMVRQLKNLASGELKDQLVFIDDYNTVVSSKMVAGCDVWLNTPHVGFEACGTSGMKAALNGVLNVSTNDGWLAEIDTKKVGWELDDEKISQSLLQTLGNQVIPMYVGNKEEWVEKMKSAREEIINNFSASRMLKEYIEKLYSK